MAGKRPLPFLLISLDPAVECRQADPQITGRSGDPQIGLLSQSDGFAFEFGSVDFSLGHGGASSGEA
jgi:hypothetical protein